MLINRHNYEEFFLLYVDNELSVADRKAVEAFVEQNPDLEEELVMMMQSVLRPDNRVVFTNKESLLKNIPANGLVNESNYEEYFVLYGDNELSNKEKDLVEQFVYKHPQYQAEFELVQQARLIPDHAIIYPDKNELYRTEDDDRVIPFRWWRIAAAAIVLLLLGITAWYMSNRNNSIVDPAYAKKNTGTQNTTAPAPANNNAQVAKGNDNVQPDNTVKEERVTNEDVKNLAAADKQKKTGKGSNIPPRRNVQQQSAIEKNYIASSSLKDPVEVTKVPVEPVKETVVAKPIFANVRNNGEPINTGYAASTKQPGATLSNEEKTVYYYVDEEEDIKLANASINKKPVRGLIRKVKGLFEGNNDDNEQPQQENKKGIRIAAFSIALK